MNDRPGPLVFLTRFLNRYFICLLIGSYMLAVYWPVPGRKFENVSLGQLSVWGEPARLSPNMLMLAILFLNAGLGVERLWGLVRNSGLVVAGLSANVILPAVFLFGFSEGMQLWHNPDDLTAILVGLALVSAMPVGSGSATYTQIADGDLSLSLGLVYASTLLSPLIVPVTFALVDFAAVGDYAPVFAKLQGGGARVVLVLCVVLPSVLGLILRRLIGADRIGSAKPALKLVSSITLLLLGYCTSVNALPQLMAAPDWGFLALSLVVVNAMCILDFVAGWWLARLLRADAGQRLALMFGVGMNNNGTSIVLASLILADQPKILVVIIFYGLVQQLVASGAVAFLSRNPSSPSQKST